jgi:hypothetical protein
MLGRETHALKADIVKLKKLGLTQSFEVGYELSPRGAAFLALERVGPRSTSPVVFRNGRLKICRGTVLGGSRAEERLS